MELAEEDRHKTTFITEDNNCRYRYRGIDSQEMGKPVATTPGAPAGQNLEKIVDNVIVWNDAFWRVCSILSHSNRSGMVFQSALVSEKKHKKK